VSHARLGASNHRWPHCAGSIREESQYQDVAGDAAIDGTGSHLLLELCVEQDKDAMDFDGVVIGVNHIDKPNGWTVHPDRCKRVQMCLDYIDRRVKELEVQFPGSLVEVLAEARVDPGALFGRTDWWGTCDITLIVTLDQKVVFIETCDYKDGRGYVSEKDNSQLQSYLAGQLRPHIGSGPRLVRPFKTEGISCRMSIVQPRTTPPVRYQDTSAKSLMDQVSLLNLAAAKTDKDDAPLTPGKHCQWCKANKKRGGHCTAGVEESLKVVNEMELSIGNELLAADVTALDNDQLVKLADAKDAILAAFEAVEGELEKRITTGQSIAGYAMVNGRSSYVWNEEEEKIVKALKGRRLKLDEIYPKKLISVAAMKKLDKLTEDQKKRMVKDFVSQKVGELTLKKVAVEEKTESMFADIPTEIPSFL
jgi:hypothetical protein